MRKDSVFGTLTVAAVLCVACSILVAGLAVSLKPQQEANKALDIKKNMLLASGLITPDNTDKETILEVYKKVNPKVVDLATGEVVENPPEGFSQREAAKNPKMNITIPDEEDIADIKRRSKLARVYEVVENGEVQMMIFPVHGKGLWSTLYGFIALAPDFNTVKGLGFYEHAETPGLGGEVDNPQWKAQWVGKKVYADNLEPQLEVIKGSVSKTDPAVEYKVDGLSGATITSNGVTNLVQYWMGENGFKPFIKNQIAARGENVQN
jgi:Na+-transporting NADH:ubiquinone oxidoreductase subunit C